MFRAFGRKMYLKGGPKPPFVLTRSLEILYDLLNFLKSQPDGLGYVSILCYYFIPIDLVFLFAWHSRSVHIYSVQPL